MTVGISIFVAQAPLGHAVRHPHIRTGRLPDGGRLPAPNGSESMSSQLGIIPLFESHGSNQALDFIEVDGLDQMGVEACV